MIEKLFATIVLTALVVNGIDIATGANMILEPVKKWLVMQIGQFKIVMPLITCIKCMPSIYGTFLCYLILPFEINLLWQIPVVILASSTLATIIYNYT